MSPDSRRPPVETLIVDDVDRLREIVADALADDEAFVVVGEAGDGEEAIAEAERLEPDLVLLDLSMPRMDGLEALTEIRRRVPGADVVVLSGFTSERMAAITRDHGALAYIEKGVEPEELVARLREHLGETSPSPSGGCRQGGAGEEMHLYVTGLDPATTKRVVNAFHASRPSWQLTLGEHGPDADVPEAVDAIVLGVRGREQRWAPPLRALVARYPETPLLVAVPDAPAGCLEDALDAGATGLLDVERFDEEMLGLATRWAIAEEERDRERTRRLEMIAGTMAHDLRAPLRALERYAGWIEEGLKTGDTDRVETALEGIQGGVERTRRLIDRQLTYARLQTQPPAAERTDPREPLVQVLEELEERIDRTGTRVEIGDLPDVLAPPEHLAELFRNLVANAIKYREEGQRPRVEIDGVIREGETRIHVSDDGIGIPEEHQEEIFDPFSRLHAEQDYEGTGLGLAICQQIVEQWEGTMEVDSEPGEGTTMVVALPAPGSS